MQRIEVMTADGRWIEVCTWSFEDNDFDGHGWCQEYRDRIGRGVAPLPNGGSVDLAQFAALRAGPI